MKISSLFTGLTLLGLVAVPMSGQSVHPDFRLTTQSLAVLVQSVPEPYRAAILAKPQAFLEDYKPLLKQPDDLLILVDKETELPEDYEPSELVALKSPSFSVNRSDLRFRKSYLPALQALDKAAKKDGLKLTLSSAYRSWAYQRDLFQRYVTKDGLATAERYSARPGRSQHQLGTVIDFGSVTPEFADTKEGKWLATRGGEFGFSLSFPQGQESLTGYIYEPWHFRYIGVQACLVQKKWFGDLQQLLTRFHHAAAVELRSSFTGKS